MSKKSATKGDAKASTEATPLPKSEPTTMQIVNVELEKIRKPKDNHRIEGADADAGIRELAASIGSTRLLNPVVLAPATNDCYEIVAGHRRIKAAMLLKWRTIPATITEPEAASDERAIENLQRLDLNPNEEALAIADLMHAAETEVRRTFGLKDSDEPDGRVQNRIIQQAIEGVARKVGKSPAWVRDRHFLGTLDKTTCDLITAGCLPMEHARELAKITDSEKRAELAKRAAIDPKGWRNKEQPMLLSDLKVEVGKHLRSLGSVPWKLDLAFAGTVACDECESNSANQTGLFEDGRYQVGRNSVGKEPAAGICTNAACFGRKSSMANRQITTGAKRVTVTVSAVKKDEREKLVPKAIDQHMPVVVKPEVFRREVKEHRERYSSAAKNKTSSSKAPVKRAETPETEAKKKFNQATQQFRWGLSRQVTTVIEKGDSDQFFLFSMLQHIDLGKPGKQLAVVKPIVEAIFDRNRTDAFDLLCKANRSKNVWLELEIEDDTEELELLTFMAEKLGLKPKTRLPVLADFLPKPKADADKPGKTKSKKPAKPAAVVKDLGDVDGEGEES